MLELYRSAVRGLPASVWWFSAATLVNRAGTMVLPFLGLYARDELGLSADQVGWVLMAFGAGSLTGVYGAGGLVDRFGGHRVQIASLVLGGFAFVALVYLRTLYGLIGGTFIAATVSEAFRPAAMSSVAAASDERNRARAFALMRLAVNAGMAVGPAVGGILAEVDFRWVFVGDGVTCLLAAAFLAVIPVGPDRPSPEGRRARAGTSSAWRDGPFLAFIGLVLLSLTAFMQLFFTLPLYLKDVFGWSERNVGLLIAMNAAIIVLLELPLVTALQRRPPLVLYGVGCAFVGAGFALFLLGVHPAIPVAMMLLVTVGEMLLFPTSSAVAANLAPKERVGQYMSLYGTAGSVAFIIAPWLGLQAYTHFGAWGLWGGTAAASLLVLPLALGPVAYLLSARKSPTTSS